MQRLFSDPFAFPVAYKTWLVSYLETSDLNLPISAINGLISILGITGVGGGTLGILPAGLILPYGGTAAPAGSLLCDGAAYLISAYSRLWEAIKTAGWGQPDANSFNVPDLRDRIPVGVGVHPDHNAVAKTDNAPLGTRRVKHKHTVVGWETQGLTPGDFNVMGGYTTMPGGGELGNHDHAPTDGLPAPTDGPSYATLNFIIVS